MSSPRTTSQKATSRHRVVVDAMGGDDAPRCVVTGVLEALRQFPERVQPVLVGDEESIHAEIRRQTSEKVDLEVIHAGQQVEMSEGGADSFRRKRDSSLNVATRLVRDGGAVGVFSAGNTGAMVTASLLNLGRIPGISRPAIGTLIPTPERGRWTVMLDAGATADCKPANLLHFGILGEVYARLVMKIDQPRVGLLNIGEEAKKGSELAQEAYRLLSASGLNFIGNVEGRDILNGRADVVVTDGFTGNVILKFAESVWTWGVTAVRKEIGEHVLAKMGAYLLRPSMRRFRNRVDYSEYGGAPLLGVNGIALIGHGRSDPKAVRNALRTTADLADQGIIQVIRNELERLPGGQVASS